MIIWHMLSKDADRSWAGLALLARKFRSVELRASLPTSHARRGTAFDYNIPAKRADEPSRVEKAAAAYAAASSPMANAAGKARAVEKAAEREEGSILHLRTASRCTRFDYQRQACARAVLDDGEDAQAHPVAELVRHEVQRPALVRRQRHQHRLPGSDRPFADALCANRPTTDDMLIMALAAGFFGWGWSCA